MPRLVRRITDTECRKARIMERDYKLYDEGNLRLLIRKSGTKVWQYPYRLNGKENICTIGQYPNVCIADARKKRDEVKSLVEQGIDPNKDKAIRYANNIAAGERTFEAVAREWHSKQVWSEGHTRTVLQTLEVNVFSHIGFMPIHQITAQDMLRVLRIMEEREALDIARRVNQRCEAIFDYALLHELCDNNPATNRAKLLKSRKRENRPHLDAKLIPDFLKALDNYRGGFKVKLAMQLLWLTFVRPGELRHARWEDFDEGNALWRIPAEQMKMKRPHLVPLSKQALEILKELRKITGKATLVFPGERRYNNPISDVTLLKVLIILGYDKGEKKFVPHGIRGTASTILNEIGRFKPDVIERQLAHIDRNSVRAAYNHAEYLEERADMMQWWADYLDKAKAAKHTTI
jgi:integrase